MSDGTLTASLPAFTVTVSAAITDAPPTINGSPATSVSAGSAYSFTPSASDPEGNALTFSIQNQPSWANFNSGTGELFGTPVAANIGKRFEHPDQRQRRHAGGVFTRLYDHRFPAFRQRTAHDQRPSSDIGQCRFCIQLHAQRQRPLGQRINLFHPE